MGIKASTAAVVLDPITVTGDTGDSADSRTAAEQSLRKNFAVKQSFAVTKSNAPVMEIPVSVQVVPRAILDDRKANSLSDAVQIVSGVGFMLVDGALAYRFKLADSTLTAQLNMQNLLGKTYYAGGDLVDSADPRFDIIPGAPRSFLGSVRVEF
ncbi:hypothetical protein SAMN02949497_0136 [Methylomagnum ishizawai]|uniref:Uncharacterized protein n=1 Tax=Methylomagnum ishizawai TaxID=1760988 RepID=A0A1Y6D4N4_9GAMM|nr:TonB-dependent receptor [Methylomagnum ishizawai]SMF97566.1 hypothetical protein SAMN02949497_0136 [Methylomagnum ishizawai]